MRLEELYPYWGYAHQQLLDTLECSPRRSWTTARTRRRPSVRDIVLRLIREERYWVGTLIAGYAEYRPLEDEHRTAAD